MENMRLSRRELSMNTTGSYKNIAYKSYLPTDLRPFPAVPAPLLYSKDADSWPEPLFVNFLRSPGIDSQPGGIDSSGSIPGLHKRLQIRAQIILLGQKNNSA